MRRLMAVVAAGKRRSRGRGVATAADEESSGSVRPRTLRFVTVREETAPAPSAR